MDLSTQTYINKYAFLTGILSKKEFIDFIDKVIMDLDNPPYEFIEATLNCNKRDVDIVSPLNEYLNKYKPDKSKFSNGFIEIIRSKYSSGEGFEKLSKKASYLPTYMNEFFEVANDLWALIYIDDTISLIHEGVYDKKQKHIEKVRKDFEDLIGINGDNVFIRIQKKNLRMNKRNKLYKIIKHIGVVLVVIISVLESIVLFKYWFGNGTKAIVFTPIISAIIFILLLMTQKKLKIYKCSVLLFYMTPIIVLTLTILIGILIGLYNI